MTNFTTVDQLTESSCLGKLPSVVGCVWEQFQIVSVSIEHAGQPFDSDRGKPKFYSSHAYGKSNSTAGAFPASRAKTSPAFLVAEVGSSGSAILTADMPFRISD